MNEVHKTVEMIEMVGEMGSGAFFRPTWVS